MTANAFYLLTATSCFLETAILAICLKARLPLPAIAILMAVYHCAYLLSDWQSYRGWWTDLRWGYIIMMTGPLLGFIGDNTLWPLALPGVLLCTAGLQTVRFAFKAGGGYTAEGKALFRYIGILAGGLAAFWSWLPTILVCFASIFVIKNARIASRERPKDRYRLEMPGLFRLLSFIFFHHAQYFLYVYVFLVAFHTTHSIEAFLIGGTMLLGWIGYSMVEKMVQTYYRSLVSMSHIVNAFVLIGMSMTLHHVTPAAVIMLWIVSGFTGGTAYTIEAMRILHGRGIPLHGTSMPLHANELQGTKRIRNLAEHLGHVTGCLCAALLAHDGFEPSTLFLVAGVLSVLAGICIFPPIQGSVAVCGQER